MKQLFFSTIALFLFQNLCAQPGTNSGGEPKWSADGNLVVYVRGDHNEAQVEGKYPATREIMIMNADGSHAQKLTSNNYSDEYPALSPDGKTILFSTNREGPWMLYTMNIDGSQQRNVGLASTSSVWNDPCRADWSPDGSQFVFPLSKNGERVLHIANKDGSGLREIPNARGIYPSWSRDGKMIAYYNKGNIYTIGIDGTNARQLTHNDPTSTIRSCYPQWSASGQNLYFLRGELNYNPNAADTKVIRIDADGTNEKQIGEIPGQKWYLGVSAKNKLIYGSNEGVLELIYVAELDGSNPTLLTR